MWRSWGPGSIRSVATPCPGSSRAPTRHASALADAGIDWSRVDYAFGGSAAAGDADTLVSRLGLTGVPFINVANGCATGGSALISAYNAIRAGAADVVVAVGFDKHPRGAFDPEPARYGIGDWYGQTGLMLTTQFFGMKIKRYMHEHGISSEVLAKVAAKAFRNGARNPNAWRRTALSEDQILEAPMIADPLTQYMFCSPAEGAVALVLASSDVAGEFDAPPVYLRAAVLKSRPYGSFEVFSPALTDQRGDSPTVAAPPARSRWPASVPTRSTSPRCRTPRPVPRSCTSPSAASAPTANRRPHPAGATEITAPPGQHRRWLPRQREPICASGLRQVYESVIQLRHGASVSPRRTDHAFTHVYAHPHLRLHVLSR